MREERNGEKVHEEMISKSDNLNTIETKKFYFILNDEKKLRNYFLKKFSSKKVAKNFYYSSDTNRIFLNIAQLKIILKEYAATKKNN